MSDSRGSNDPRYDSAVTIRVFNSADELARALAERVASALAATPDLVLGLAAGRTFAATYAELAALHARGTADFSRATTFLLDEFVGLAAGHSGSLRSEVEHALIARVNLDRARVHFLNGASPDPDAECSRYERAVEKAGGIGLQLLGIGANGHIAFNEPGEGLIARTHRERLSEATRQDNLARFGGDLGEVPHEALTMGVGAILRAGEIALAATGSRKAVPVARAVVGPVAVPRIFSAKLGCASATAMNAVAANKTPLALRMNCPERRISTRHVDGLAAWRFLPDSRRTGRRIYV